MLAEVTHWQPQLPIGILPQEYEAPQSVDICVQVAVRDTGLGLAHNLQGSFDYRCIFEAVNTLAAEGHIDLLEAVTEAIAQACLAHPLVLGVWVRVHKVALVPHCQGLGIQRTFTR
jgi:dihydroneopterin aldolase